MIQENEKSYCSFCNKKEVNSILLVENPSKDTFICIECIENIHFYYKGIHEIDEIDEKNNNQYFKDLLNSLSPKKLKNKLDETVIGQENAKKDLSTFIINHYKKAINLNNNYHKNNILLIGPTGSGKTLLIEEISQILNIPFISIDSSRLTEEGFKGQDISNMFISLLEKADNDIEKAEKGIIFLDEIDKLYNNNNVNFVGSKGVQQSLLKILDGDKTQIEYPDNNSFEDNPKTINTKNILFIAGGAFSGIEDNIKKRKNLNNIGFSSNKDNQNTENLYSIITEEDLKDFGFIPEFIGRFQTKIILHKLKMKDYEEIILSSKNSVYKDYEKLFKIDNIELNLEKNVIKKIAQLCEDKKLGARGLNIIFNYLFKSISYNIEDYKNSKININIEFFNEKIKGHLDEIY